MLPCFVYPIPCIQINYWIVFILVYLVLGVIVLGVLIMIMPY
jgi:hypothetical protein